MAGRLTPVGSSGGAEAILVGMSVQITHHDVIGDVAGSGREVAALPELLAPVAFADVLELLLDFARGAPFGPANEVGDFYVLPDDMLGSVAISGSHLRPDTRYPESVAGSIAMPSVAFGS